MPAQRKDEPVKAKTGQRIQCSTNQLLLAAALFLAAFANFAFFRNLAATFSGIPWSTLRLASLALLLVCALVLFLSTLSFRPVLKPVLVFVFLLSSVTAYFMDTYNVIIDSDMIANVVATDSAESLDLLTPRLLLYFGVLGVLPSLLLLKVRVRPQTAVKALRARLLLAVAAILLMLALVLSSSAFYTSFAREHKLLRYYANPLTPIYSAYKFARMHFADRDTVWLGIGEDAQIPVTDVDRELVILVVGETARADRFSLNGYSRETNPQLGQQDVISFKRVTACGTSTEISVPCMFSIYDENEFSDQKAQTTENLLDVLDRVGVNILWRDNNSNSKGVADRLAYEDFRSPENNPVCDEECRDEGMLSGLQEFIDRQSSGDILIVLHQMGSHGPAYYKRYPDRFRKFIPTCDTNQLDSCDNTEIGNAYDNTILYTDYFLSEVINLLRRNDSRFETAMLYAGDHGESLGESGVYLHGLPNWIAPDAQTRVPMILWIGKNFDEVDPDALRRLEDEPWSHNNIFHTLLGLFETRTEDYDPAKDILQQARDRVNAPMAGN